MGIYASGQQKLAHQAQQQLVQSLLRRGRPASPFQSAGRRACDQRCYICHALRRGFLSAPGCESPSAPRCVANTVLSATCAKRVERSSTRFVPEDEVSRYSHILSCAPRIELVGGYLPRIWLSRSAIREPQRFSTAHRCVGRSRFARRQAEIRAGWLT